MTIEVRVPALPESVSDGVIVAWHKQPGDAIVRDEALVDIETDKVVLEVPAPNDGVLDSILINSGDTVIADQVIGVINDGAMATAMKAGTAAAERETPEDRLAGIGPAARKLLADYDLDPERISGTGRDGRITKADVLTFLRSRPADQEPADIGQHPFLQERKCGTRCQRHKSFRDGVLRNVLVRGAAGELLELIPNVVEATGVRCKARDSIQQVAVIVRLSL